PDYTIKRIGDLPALLQHIKGSRKKENGLRIVAIGGGTGLPCVLEGLKDYTKNITAIVTVTDSGRSTGLLRREFNIPAPGDMRNCLVALSDSEQLMLDLFNYRFGGKMFKDMSFGNLLIVALAKTTGSFENAVKAASKILAIRGKVLPSTNRNTHVCVELADGTVFKNEDEIIQRNVPPSVLAKRPPIKKVFLAPENVKILPEARKAILDADLITIGPGSLYTSVITNLLVKGMKEAIAKSHAKKVYIANIMTQVNQTPNFKLSGYVNAVEKYLGKGVLDFVVYNSKKPDSHTLGKYLAEQSIFVENDLGKKTGRTTILSSDMAEKPCFSGEKATKQKLLRHDSKKLAKLLISLVR
ncbi:MAG: YvcK family protein, partial [Candidatus Diapherotrites archaeon]|nr:YvcK family protein [Candidatus Diapherotrites archaeon]